MSLQISLIYFQSTVEGTVWLPTESTHLETKPHCNEILCYFDPWMLMTWILMKSSMRSSQWFTILTVNQQWIPTYSMITIESAVTVPYCKMPIGCFLNGSIMYILQSSCRNFLSLSNQKLYRIMQVFLKQFIGIVVDQFLMLYNINIAPPTPLNNVAQ